MESHRKWGLGFILLGAVTAIASFRFTPLIIYSVLLIFTGMALILFGHRERKIEEVIE